MSNIIIAIIIQGMISAFLINPKEKNGFFFLYVYLLVVCSDFAFELFLYNYFHGDTSYMDTIPGSFRLLKGPLILLFTQQIIARPLSNRWAYVLFIPFALVFFLNINLVLAMLLKTDVFWTIHKLYQFVFSGYVFYWVGYLTVSLVQFLRYGKSESPLYKGYIIFLVYLIVGVVAYYITYKIGVAPDTLRTVYNYMFFVQFGLLIHLHWRSRQVLTQFSIEKEKYQNSVLKEEDIHRISKNIKQYMEDHEDYIMETFSLDYLANALQVPKHHMSQAVTEGLQTTFYELVNSYRLELFLKKLHKNQNANIADLSYQVGFKSRTTFYKYFKSKHGVTPSEYKIHLKNNILQQG